MADGMPSGRRIGIAGALLTWLAAGCAAHQQAATTITEAIQAQQEIPEAQLLDVGIEILDPGLGAAQAEALEEEGVFRDLRKAEARYLPTRLMETLQATGQWGAVRVTPRGPGIVDLEVKGKIVESTGKDLVLEVRAIDSRGRLWLAKTYRGEADPRAYEEPDDSATPPPGEPFQDLYNRIANDLLAARTKLDGEELAALRTVSGLRFAAELAPAAYADYLGVDKRGRRRIERLPAEDDPMIARIAAIRDRDHLFIDTLNEHYASFQAQMAAPYDHWRKYSYEEELAREALQRQARARKIIGALAIIGAVFAPGNSQAASNAREVAVLGGVIAIQSGIAKAAEAKIHVEAVRELAASFDAEVAPLVVEVEGQTLRLAGSAETQYATWKKLLREIFATETGLPRDPDDGSVEAAVEPQG